MAFSSGTFSRLFDWTTDRDAGVKIRADRFDQELDGFATGLTTTILKDGTQTTTAVVPFAFGISIVDNKAITLGTNSDITIQYDETTNDSLEIAAAVEGAALGIVLKSDQGDDNADQHKLSIADGGTLTLASKISGSFVTYLTHTPNSTVASSTLAVAGNLTVGGNLTLGSGAELSEAELEMLDGITAGTVAASKAVVVDANKDIASFRNITLTGELDAGSLDVSGDADIDGTLEADAITLNGSAITTTATLSTGISNGNVPVFTSGVADDDFLRVNSTSIEGRSASEVLSDISASPVAGSSSIVTTGALNSGSITSGFGAINNGSSNITTTGVGTFASLDISGDIDVDGTANIDVVDIDGAVDMASTLTIGGTLSLTGGDSGDILLVFNTDRTWQFQQVGDDGSTSLALKSNNDSKSFTIQNSNGDADFNFFTSHSGTPNFTLGKDAVLIFEGSSDDANETTLTVTDPSADRTITLPDATGTVVLETSSGTVFNESSADVDFRVESNGETHMLFVDGGNDAVILGHSAKVDGINDDNEGVKGSGGQLQLHGATPVIDVFSYSTTNATHGGINFMKSRNNTVGSNTVITTGDVIGSIAFGGFDGADYASIMGKIDFQAGGSGMAENDTAGEMVFYTTPDGSGGGGSSERMRITSDGNIRFSNGSTSYGNISLTDSNNLSIGCTSTDHVGLTFGSSILPRLNESNNDDGVDLGAASFRFDDVFATNGTIQTSDQNEKQDIASATAKELNVAKKLSSLFKTFRWKSKVTEKGDNARTHTGIIAQEIQSAFSAEGLDASKYGLFTSDTWWEKEIKVDAVKADEEKGIEARDAYTYLDIKNEKTDDYTERTRLGVRYPELFSFIFSSIESRLTALESA